jgi:hypothetical protein
MEPTHKKPLRNAHICSCTRTINPEAISVIALGSRVILFLQISSPRQTISGFVTWLEHQIGQAADVYRYNCPSGRTERSNSVKPSSCSRWLDHSLSLSFIPSISSFYQITTKIWVIWTISSSKTLYLSFSTLPSCRLHFWVLIILQLQTEHWKTSHPICTAILSLKNFLQNYNPKLSSNPSFISLGFMVPGTCLTFVHTHNSKKLLSISNSLSLISVQLSRMLKCQ